MIILHVLRHWPPKQQEQQLLNMCPFAENKNNVKEKQSLLTARETNTIKMTLTLQAFLMSFHLQIDLVCNCVTCKGYKKEKDGSHLKDVDFLDRNANTKRKKCSDQRKEEGDSYPVTKLRLKCKFQSHSKNQERRKQNNREEGGGRRWYNQEAAGDMTIHISLPNPSIRPRQKDDHDDGPQKRRHHHRHKAGDNPDAGDGAGHPAAVVDDLRLLPHGRMPRLPGRLLRRLPDPGQVAGFHDQPSVSDDRVGHRRLHRQCTTATAAAA